MIPFRPSGIVVFLSDFGLRDGYVGEVHGVLLSRFPDVRIVDATHEIAPQDVRSGAFVLRRILPSFPAGTVFLAVVDPGVGTSRRPLVACSGNAAWVGPDNGLLSWAAGADAAWHRLDRPDLVRQPACRTFHGRDLFAPAAAALASGAVAPPDVGPRVPDPLVLSFPGWAPGPRRLSGSVVYVDRFGNLVTSIPADALGPVPADGSPVTVAASGREEAGAWGPYCEARVSVHPDSSGFLEVALSGDRADSRFGVRPGDPVEVSW